MIRETECGPTLQTTPERTASEYDAHLIVHHHGFCRCHVRRVCLPSWTFLVRAQSTLHNICLTGEPRTFTHSLRQWKPRGLFVERQRGGSHAEPTVRKVLQRVVPDRLGQPLSLTVDQSCLCWSTTSMVASRLSHSFAPWPPRPLEHIRPADCLGSGAAAALSAVGVPVRVSRSSVTWLTQRCFSSSSAFSLARLSPSSFVLRARRERRRRLWHGGASELPFRASWPPRAFACLCG